MVTFTVEFDRTDRVYKPGETVYCVIRVNFDTTTKFRSIYVRCRGKALVFWTDVTTTNSITFSNEEIYFEQYETLLGTKDGDGTVMEPAISSHKVYFELPNKNLPQDFDYRPDYYGKIRYEVKVHMTVPWGFDQVEREYFHIEPCFNLNDQPHLRDRVREEDSKTFGFGAWKTDPLRIACILPRRGFAPGDRIQYNLEVNNESDIEVTKISVKLLECIQFQAESPYKKFQESKRIMWEHKFKDSRDRPVPVLPLQRKRFSKDILLAETIDEFKILHGCEIITAQYFVLTTAHVSGMHTNLVNLTEIKIGTIPLTREREVHPLPSYDEVVKNVKQTPLLK